MEHKEELKKIKELAARPLKTESEMGMVELVVMLYNEHDMACDMVRDLVKYANYPFKLTVLNNTHQIVPINFSRIWNKCIRETKCDYICFMDSDVFVMQDWLKRMMESFEDPSIDLVVPVLDKTSGPQQKAQCAQPYGATETLNSIMAAQMVIYRKSLFDAIGNFDERFLLYGQDSEFGHRILKKGRKGVVRKDVFVHHIGSFSIDKFNKEEKKDYNPSVEREYARGLFKYLTK